MDYVRDTARRHIGRGLLLLMLAGSFAGCGSEPSGLKSTEGPDGADTIGRVCPGCGVNTGGETGDFGGDLAACAGAYAKREVDRAEADALGFDATDSVRAIEEPIDAPMTWAAIDDSGDGAPARGYDAETRVQVTLTVDKLTFHELDLERCNGDRWCLSDGERGLCSERYVVVSASGELRTSDGAIAAVIPSQDVQGLWPDSDNNPSVFAWIDLRDVTGRLELEPAFPEPRLGELVLSLQYGAGRTLEYGLISITIRSDRDTLLDELLNSDGGSDEDGGIRFPKPRDYCPLQARWGSPPPIPTVCGGRATY